MTISNIYHKVLLLSARGFRTDEMHISLTKATFDELCKEYNATVYCQLTKAVISSIGGVPIHLGTQDLIGIKL